MSILVKIWVSATMKEKTLGGMSMKKTMLLIMLGCFVTAPIISAQADEMQDAFLEKMADGLNARWEYDKDEATMSSSEFIDYRAALVDEEYKRLEEYKDTEFTDAKFDLMAQAYIEAIEMQANALKYYMELPNLYELEWSAGYNLRAALIPNFVDNYRLDVAEEDVAAFRDANTITYTLEPVASGQEKNVIESEIELFNNEGIKVVITGMDEPDLYSTNINLRIENLNHHDILVNTSDFRVVVNDVMVSSYLSAEVKSGKTANTTMTFWQEELDNAGIDKMRELCFGIVIADADSYNDLYRGEEKFLVIDDEYQISEKTVYTDKETIRKVQELLNTAGYDCGTADGVPGKNTNSALLQFERDHNLPETTDMTPELVEILEASIN